VLGIVISVGEIDRHAATIKECYASATDKLAGMGTSSPPSVFELPEWFNPAMVVLRSSHPNPNPNPNPNPTPHPNPNPNPNPKPNQVVPGFLCFLLLIIGSVATINNVTTPPRPTRPPSCDLAKPRVLRW
jgi:hypothetical protein